MNFFKIFIKLDINTQNRIIFKTNSIMIIDAFHRHFVPKLVGKKTNIYITNKKQGINKNK